MVLQALCIGRDTSKQHIYKQTRQNKSEKGVDSRWQEGKDFPPKTEWVRGK